MGKIENNVTHDSPIRKWEGSMIWRNLERSRRVPRFRALGTNKCIRDGARLINGSGPSKVSRPRKKRNGWAWRAGSLNILPQRDITAQIPSDVNYESTFTEKRRCVPYLACTRIEIPLLYKRENFLILNHCWHTHQSNKVYIYLLAIIQSVLQLLSSLITTELISSARSEPIFSVQLKTRLDCSITIGMIIYSLFNLIIYCS